MKYFFTLIALCSLSLALTAYESWWNVTSVHGWLGPKFDTEEECNKYKDAQPNAIYLRCVKS